tara:strand:- start:619 stop:2895 length:2277 start_codon:yes stop_codon:yes gene_type:complete
MTDLARLGLRIESEQAELAEDRLDGLTGAANRAENATDKLAMAARHANGSVGTMNVAVRQQQAVLAATRGAMGLTASEGLNMSRQFTDIGVTAAMGMNPLMIAIQQGPQLMDVFQQAAIRTGRTIKAVALEAGAAVWTAMAPILPFVAAIAAAVGTVAGAWTLATRSMRKDVDDLTTGMGLTEKQMKRLEEAGVSTSVTAGDAFRGLGTTIKEVLVENFGTQIDWMAGAWSKTMDFLTEVGSVAVAGIGAAFVGTYRAIINTWQRAPAALGDIVISAANGIIATIEKMLNSVSDKINGFINKANEMAKRAGLPGGLPTLGTVSIARIGNPNAGAAAALDRTNAAGYADAYRDVRGALAGGMDRWRENTAASGHARVLDAAGDAERTRAAAAGRSGRSGSGSATVDAVKEIDNQPLRDQLTLLRLQATLFGASEAARAEAMAREAKRLELQAQGFTAANDGYTDAIDAAGELARGQVELGQGQDAYNQSLRFTLDLLDQIDAHARAASQGLSEAFGAPGRALGDLMTSMTGFQAQMEAIRLREEEMTKAGTLNAQQASLIERDRAQAQIQNYGDMASAAKGFFKEGSDGYRLLQAAEQAYRLVQFAMAVQAMVMDTQQTGVSVGNSLARGAASAAAGAAKMFEMLGPFAFPVVAGMLAVLAALGLRGGSSGGGGRSVSSSVETAQGNASQAQATQSNASATLAQSIRVEIGVNDDRFNAYVDGRTGPAVVAGVQASVATAHATIPAEQGRKARMTVGGR